MSDQPQSGNTDDLPGSQDVSSTEIEKPRESNLPESDGTKDKDTVENPTQSYPSVAFNKMTFSPHLSISFQVKRGEFVIVVGAVGSGKSSLLAALVGEIQRIKGQVKLGGSVGFCPQSPWIQNATLRNNILFGQPFDRAKYDQVIQCCALESDFEMLSGDATEIGEGGVTLSGGQKARVSLARAAYSDADIYLLDDPLSAVDAHVGRHLLEECLCRHMTGKTRILVTHQLQVAPRADRIVCMDQGRIVEEGTYEELLSKGGNFARLIEKFKDKEGGENVEEEMKTSTESKPERPEKGLMELEGRSTGSVPWIVYRDYARSGGGLWIIPVIGGVLLISNAVNIMTSLWLGAWTINRYNLSTKIYVAIYACLGSLQGIFSFIFGYILVVIGNRAARKLHEKVATPLALLNLGIESSRKCANVIF